MLSDWRVTWNSLLEKFCKSFIYLVPLLLKQKILLEFLESLFSNFVFSVSLQISCKKETTLKKLREIWNYGKSICNVFSWDTVKIGIIIRAKVQFSVWFKMMGCSRVSSMCMGIVNLLLVKCRQGLRNCIKNPHCFVSVSFYV